MLGIQNPGRLLRASGYGLVLVCSIKAHAWHDLGHMLVGQLAYDQITEKHSDLKDSLDELLKAAQASYEKQGFDPKQLETMAKAATFLDTYSGKNRDTKNWHYINGPYVPTGEFGKVNESAIEDAYKELPNAPIELATSVGVLQNNQSAISNGEFSDEVIEAFIKILHIAGDIHQPLHNLERFDSRYPEGDRGGNEFRIQSISGDSNLHSFWDDIGLALGQLRWDDPDVTNGLADALKKLKAFVGTPDYPSDIQPLNTDVDPWELTSHMFIAGRSLVYDGIEYDSQVSSSYQKKVQSYGQYLVYMAGNKLAELLVYGLTGQLPEKSNVGVFAAKEPLTRGMAKEENRRRFQQFHKAALASQKYLEESGSEAGVGMISRVLNVLYSLNSWSRAQYSEKDRL